MDATEKPATVAGTRANSPCRFVLAAFKTRQFVCPLDTTGGASAGGMYPASLFSSLSLFLIPILIPHLLLLPPRSPPACFDIEVASGIRAYSTNGWITNTS